MLDYDFSSISKPTKLKKKSISLRACKITSEGGTIGSNSLVICTVIDHHRGNDRLDNCANNSAVNIVRRQCHGHAITPP